MCAKILNTKFTGYVKLKGVKEGELEIKNIFKTFNWKSPAPKRMETIEVAGRQSWAERMPNKFGDGYLYTIYERWPMKEVDGVETLHYGQSLLEAKAKLKTREDYYIQNVQNELEEKGASHIQDAKAFGQVQGFITKPTRKHFANFA